MPDSPRLMTMTALAPTLLCAALAGPVPAWAQAPATPTGPVVDTLYGTPVPDPYRWLEDEGSAEARAWFLAQGGYARAVLDALPGRAHVLAHVRAIGAAAPPDISLPREAGGRWFYTVRRAGEPVARGFVRDAWTGEERLLVDPSTVGGSGHVGGNVLHTFRPSPDGRLVLHGVSTGGSEAIVLRVRDVATGVDIGGEIERNRWDMSTWLPDGRTFLYLRLRDLPAEAPPTEFFRDIHVRRHRLGEPADSGATVLSAGAVGLPDRMLPVVDVDARNGLAFGRVTFGGIQQQQAFFLAPLDDVAQGSPAWRPLFSLADSVLDVAARGSDLYVLTRKGAQLGRVVRTPLDAPDLGTAEVVLPEGAGNLQSLGAALDALYVRGFAEGAFGIHRIPWGGEPAPVSLPPATSVGPVRASPLRPGLIITLDSRTSVPRPYRYNPSIDALEELRLAESGPFDQHDSVVVETLLAPGHDGVGVPMSIVRPAGAALDGSMPIMMGGYGAYGIASMTEAGPPYVAELRPWFEAGGATADCHVRGGGYYGEAWHRAGQKATKPNSWLDFIACAEYLERAGYTRPERLVALGVSAGGITVGRAITERPELFGAAILMVGVLDAVRFETTPNGPPNIPEFGSVATEEGFRALLAMSAVHHVKPGTAYPAVLLTAGLNDPRVAAWQPGKMAAALQAATTSGRPVLLRVDEAAGHSPVGDTDDQYRALMADFIAFMMAETGTAPYRTATPDASGPR
jgi:prolyl oligopeptidase